MQRTDPLHTPATVALLTTTAPCIECEHDTREQCLSCRQPFCFWCLIHTSYECGDKVCPACHFYRCADVRCGSEQEIPA